MTSPSANVTDVVFDFAACSLTGRRAHALKAGTLR